MTRAAVSIDGTPLKLITQDEPKRCEWVKVLTNAGSTLAKAMPQCENQARVVMELRGTHLGDICWEHADELMHQAGMTVSLEERRLGWAKWKRDTAEARFTVELRDRPFKDGSS